MGANCLANIQATEAPLATSGVFERRNDDTEAFTKYGGIRSHVRTTTEVESKISNKSDVTLPSIVDENHDMQSQQILASADNAKTDAFCGNANVPAQQIENSSDLQNVSLNEDNNGY
ncbi:hypothetical protein OIU79_027950 [Salix purpurea]|uniref:Uncharacterized protein n=1 Tax=Salix purpurea TaxID=77065 RepID=A0A9Q1A258_SALPP|nr:hypothetical protein OIU79_027950 [Salix purpurea]